MLPIVFLTRIHVRRSSVSFLNLTFSEFFFSWLLTASSIITHYYITTSQSNLISILRKVMKIVDGADEQNIILLETLVTVEHDIFWPRSVLRTAIRSII